MRLLALAPAWFAALLFFMPTGTAGAQTDIRNTIQCYTSFDQDFFYVAAVVKKPNLAGTQTAPFSDPLKDDAISVYLQREDEAVGASRGQHSIQMAVSVAGGAQLYRGAKATPLHDFHDILKADDGTRYPFKYGVTIRGKLNQPGTIDTGYSVEMAIPWIEIGGSPKTGEKMRMNLVAFSAAADSPPFISLAQSVTTSEDIQSPKLWDEIIFVDAPVKSAATAPDAHVSARLFTARPLVDGILSEGEWNALTSFGFAATSGGGSSTVAMTTATARIKPAVELKKSKPAVIPVARVARQMPERSPQAIPRLIFTLYQYDYQCDPRKRAPLFNVRTYDNASLLASHPMNGDGPWMSYDRVDWHREQLEAIRRAGIDVVLPIYRAGIADKQQNSQRGLVVLADALNYLAMANRDYPLVGCFLDTSSLVGPDKKQIDLAKPAERDSLYAAIKDFYLNIPVLFRASIPLSEKNGGGTACIVVLSSHIPFSAIDAAAINECRSRFHIDFGQDLVILGSTDFKATLKLDGYMDDTRGLGIQSDDSGWIKTASIGPGSDTTLHSVKGAGIRPRLEGMTFRNEWKEAITKKPDWLLAGVWNGYQDGCEIGPTLEDGLEYGDITRTYSRAFAGLGAMRAAFISSTAPSVAPAGANYAVSLRVLNAGSTDWTTDGFALAFRWARGGNSSGAPRLVPLPGPIKPGQAISIPFTLKMPTQPGDWALTADMAQISKKNEVTAYFSGLGSTPMNSMIKVVGDGDAALPDCAASLMACDLPSTLEAGGTYTARVTLRNEGAKTWKKGDDGIINGRIWRYYSPINGVGAPEKCMPVPMADASAAIPSDVPPGQQVTVAVLITFSSDDGTPLESWSAVDDWTYQLRWEYSDKLQSAVTDGESLTLTDADLGVQFTADLTPSELPGERKLPVRLSVRNAGPQTWRKDAARVGCHWYYLDGSEVVWEDQLTSIPQDVPPGTTVSDFLAWTAAPPYDGVYWLVWDVKIGDTWASTTPSVRPYETLLRRVQVVNGHLTFVDLDKAYNFDGITSGLDRTDGDFNGAGQTYPAELMPPFATTEICPSTMWLPTRTYGLESSRRISFTWGPKGAKDYNFIQCLGQRVTIAEPKKAISCKQIHIVAAATSANASGGFTVVFADGTEQYSLFPVSAWDAPPANNEEVAMVCRYTHSPKGISTDKPAALFHYIIKVADTKKVVAIKLPNAPAIKIAAITLEK